MKNTRGGLSVLALVMIMTMPLNAGAEESTAPAAAPAAVPDAQTETISDQLAMQIAGEAAQGEKKIFLSQAALDEYPIGVNDVLEVSVIQPDKMTYTVHVSPDGFISFPFIGSVKVKGLTLSQVQEKIRSELENGFLKYPIVYVSLVESRSRRFFVYGEVEKPGTFPLEENTTILRAISMAGGLTKYGSSSGVKLLSPKATNEGYELTKVNMKSILAGDPQADILIKPGDILVITGGMF